MKNQAVKTMLCAGASILAMGGTTPVFAQDTGSAADDQASPTGDTIMVTARRREESLQDTPLAVTAASAERLEQVGAVDITSIQRITPNTTIEAARGSNSTLIAFIRGVGQQDPLWGFEPGVGLYVDDVYIARPQGAVLDIFDVERVEVLRGPQGTLYGRNTIGGAIKYVTRRMDTDTPEFTARVNVGSYGQFDQILSGSAPVSDTFVIGAALANYTRDGFGTNLNTGADHYNKDVLAGRISAEWAPTDSLFFRFAADRSEDNSNAKHGHRLLPSGDTTLPVTDNVYDTRAGIGDDNVVETQGMSLTGEWMINDAFTLKSITAFREGDTVTPIDFDALPQQDFDVPATYQDEQFSQEVQLLFNQGPLSGVAGLYYLDGQASGDFDVILSALGLTIYQAGDQKKENLAAFADVNLDLTDKLSISVGGRFTRDETTADVLREAWLGLGSGSFDPANTGSIFLATQTGYEGLSRTDEEFTPRASIQFEPSDTQTLYASYSRGFKAGGFDPRARQDLDPTGLSQQGFGPEIVDSYELGLKQTALGGRLNMNTALFYADYSDQQITVQQGADADNDGTNDTFVSSVFNAGQSTYKGAEFEGVFVVSDTIVLDAMLGYIDAQIDEIISGGVNIADGFVTQNTPELTWRLGASVMPNLPADYGDLTLTASVGYRDAYNLFNVANGGFDAGTNVIFPNGGPALDPESYTVVDASAIWEVNDRWQVSLTGRNLTDEEYRVAAYNFVTPSQLGFDSAYSAFYGAPRTVTASVEFTY